MKEWEREVVDVEVVDYKQNVDLRKSLFDQVRRKKRWVQNRKRNSGLLFLDFPVRSVACLPRVLGNLFLVINIFVVFF